MKDSTKTSSKMTGLLFLGIVFSAFQISYSNIPEFCRLPADSGQGTSFNFAVYYDASKDQCSPFLYNGEGGNANRFQNERECLRNCSVNAENVYPMDARKACHFKKLEGTCNGNYLRYYYDSVYDKCKRFIWTGCIGNGNRFFDFNSCNSTCAGIHDDGNEPEEHESDTPIAIICGVLLALIVVAIIGTVVFLTLKSKKKKKGAGKSKEPQADAPLQAERDIEMS
ncbi:kunitz-type U19-barytoxin-Tl1a [Oreochromis niloticus]|uniref:Si:dkeyp-73b11.8 n=2 Tax=Oreochromis TaxID=8139 RepID=A0A669BI68_ORENI|nr:kunitz-type U19-barytoxin-Tl1a [Oreochromis niloticus]XP_039471048.1 BPTI/Kunitz domain-containing protein [Oreochromis aureus]CAI5664142.1 unnamed protein product [Mustela putorius furo]